MNEGTKICVASPPPRPLLAFDGGCGFCRLAVSRWREDFRGHVELEPAQSVAGRFPEIPPENFEKSIHLILPDGRVETGAGAIFEALALAKTHRGLWWVYGRSALFARATESGYAFVANHRALFSRLVRVFYGGDFAHPTFNVSGEIFFRLMGLIYLFAFLSLGSQIIGLAGERGIVPAAQLMNVVAERNVGFGQLPTLCHFIGAGDDALRLLCGLGVAFSLAMLLGLVPTLSAAATWLLYLSLCSVVETFLNFQWDAMLLEAGFLTIFIAPLSLRLRPGWNRCSRFARWLVVWLLFRLMFSAGVVKLASQDAAWWDLSALTYHYWSQCLPPWTAWYFDQLPLWAHKLSCFIMFAIELVVPFLVFCPRRLRHFAAGAFLALMAVIMASGNYGFFDLLTCVLCVVLIDDHAWHSLAARLRRRPRPAACDLPMPDDAPHTRAFRRLAIPVLLLIFLLTWLPFGRVVAGAQQICGVGKPWLPPQPGWLVALYQDTAPFRSVNGYGLFAVMTKHRDEIILEGTDDGVTWRPYEFNWKPGDLAQRPRFSTPHMPRLDWQMWFAALGEFRGNPWLIGTTARLLEGEPSVIALFGTNPFPDKPPRAIRALAYRYHFTSAAERDASGNWWKRDEPPRVYFPPIVLHEGRPAFAQ